MKMQTLMQPEVKLKIASFDHSAFQVKEKSNNPKFIIDFRFYQKLFVLFLITCAFLIFPESPQDSEILCKKYNSKEACIVW